MKCDGQSPACSGCTKYGRAASCSLGDTDSHQQRDYVAYLQASIEELRSRLGRQTTLDNTPPEQHGPIPQANEDDGVAHNEASGSSQDASSRASWMCRIDKMVSQIGALPILASSFDPADPQSPCLATVVLAAASEATWLVPVVDVHDHARIRDLLPDRATAKKLADHYFEDLYPRLPFFSREGFWTQFAQAYSLFDDTSMPMSSTPSRNWQTQHSRRYEEGVTPDAGAKLDANELGYSLFSVLIVLAISIASLSTSTGSIVSHNSEQILNAGLSFRNYAILPNTTAGLQAILFLILYSMLNPSRLDSWQLVGIGMRICVDLGLHQESKAALQGKSDSFLETRRRLFWSMYSLDRSISIGMGRPCEVSDHYIHVEIPSFEIGMLASSDEVLGFKQRYRVLQLQSLLYERLYMTANVLPDPEPVVGELRRRLETWDSANRDTLSAPTKLLLESEWHQSIMLLYRPCRAIRTRSRANLSQLWTSALAFLKIYRTLVEANEIFYVQVASEKAYSAGLAVLYAYWQLAKGSTEDGIDLMEPLSLWQGVSDVNFILRALSDRWHKGRTLASHFERLGARTATRLITLQLNAAENPVTGGSDIAQEVTDFWDHSGSITSGQGSAKVIFPPASNPRSHLQDLVVELVRGA
ncbi:hypothetical protein LTR84_003808 [Exophiala bonariae]|uniref:Xylanolytic transcriptional activator regulatory domain-containing protein n=1 Tax=Exophiala bonariae TaxID=1690606 RepID=A0AAV9N6J2_9EURO|nr:hypothetical protein LTR84_003808 [Exophiala bonariae]